MDRYITFNAEKFLREAKQWKAEKKTLQKILDSIPELSAIQNSEVHSTNISSPTETTAMKRIKITKELDRLSHYERILNYGLSRLTEEEKYIIDGFYFRKGYVSVFVDECCHTYECSPRTIYSKKADAVKSFSRIVDRIL